MSDSVVVLRIADGPDGYTLLPRNIGVNELSFAFNEALRMSAAEHSLEVYQEEGISPDPDSAGTPFLSLQMDAFHRAMSESFTIHLAHKDVYAFALPLLLDGQIEWICHSLSSVEEVPLVWPGPHSHRNKTIKYGLWHDCMMHRKWAAMVMLDTKIHELR